LLDKIAGDCPGAITLMPVGITPPKPD